MLAAAALYGQEFRGTFSGVVTDPQGSAMPNVRVTAIQTATGNKSETVSSTTGEFTIPFLGPGEYSIIADSPGFKHYERKGLTLSLGEHPVVDIKMEVGEQNQSVQITAEAPMIESANASVGQAIPSEEVDDLPINGRTAIMLTRLSMGVIGTNEPGPVRPFDNGTAAGFSVSGAPTQSNEILINGVPNTTWDKRLAYSPPQDAVQEVSVHAFESDSAYGHTGGGVANMITRGGTNSLHFTLSEFNQVSKLDANLFFSNANGVGRPVTNYNQYGVSAGAPVYLPKIYNGRNRMFWFFAMERLHDSDPANSVVEGGSTYTTVPTAAERTGDFSALLAIPKTGSSYQLYDPASGVQSGSQVARTPFVNNILPASRLNPIALNYMKLYPLPNLTGLSNGENNYGITIADSDGYDNELGRIDFNISDKNKLAYEFHHNFRVQNKNIYFSNPAYGDYLSRANWGTSLDDIYTLSPSLILDVRGAWTRFHESNAAPGDGINPATYGFPASLAASSQFVGLPYMQFAGGCGANSTAFQCIGMTGDSSTPYDTFQIFASIVKIRGNHTIKAGTDLRDYRESTFPHGNSDGTFSYSTNWITGPLNNNAAPPFGGDMASFLLGLPTSGSYDLNSHSTSKSDYYSVYLQDDWRVRSNLTLNLGLRWEHETPTVEKFDRAVNGFNPTIQNPISAAAAAAYAKNPIPQVAPSQFTALGGLTYASASNPNVYNTASSLFSPRIGVAWSPAKLGGKTVLRAGVGTFVAPTGINGAQTLNQEGFSATTQMTVTNNNYLTPASTLLNPFPNGIAAPSSSNGPGTFLGQSITYFNPNVRNSYSLRWNAGVQRQIPGQIVVEVAYIGNHAVHLPISTQLNYIPRQYLSTSLYRDAADTAVINSLAATVPNPFLGLLPSTVSLGTATTVARSQLVTRFPQYPVNGVTMQYNNAGESYYNSLNVRAQKRFTHGLVLIENFTYSKLIERTTYLNATDPAPEKRVGSDSRPLRETLAISYELPFGRNKRFNLSNRFVDGVFGGWAANGAIIFQSGPPIGWGNVVYLGGPLNLKSHPANPLAPGAAFDTTQFYTASGLQPSNNIIYFDTQFNNLRRDPTKNADLSMLKKFTFGERRYLQIRFEGFNITNRVTFASPNTSPTSTAFGEITSQANTPRRIQVGARLVW
jgi:hypothetical protein